MFERASKQTPDPKNSTAPGPRPPVLKFLDPPLSICRIDVLVSLACRKRHLNKETVKTEVLCYSGCDTIKILHWSNAVSADRSKSCSASPTMVTAMYEWCILDWGSNNDYQIWNVMLKFKRIDFAETFINVWIIFYSCL